MSRRKSSPNFIKPGGPTVRRGRHRTSPQQASLTKETFTATVRDIASDGRAIAPHPSGKTVFVPGLWIGEEAEIQITAKKKNIFEGVCLTLINAHPDRIEPLCPHHGFDTGTSSGNKCGGCPWLFIGYEQQLAVKQQRVENQLARITDTKPNTIWPSPKTLSYRSRAQLKTDGKIIGFASSESNNIAAIQQCLVLSEKNQELLAGLLKKLPNPNWQKKGKQPWRELHIDEDMQLNDIAPDQPRLFQQANRDQNIAMQQWLREKLGRLSEQSTQPLHILELFCGAGNFTEQLLQIGNVQITAIDGKGPAIDQLEEKHLPGATALSRDLYDDAVLPPLHRQFGPFNILLVDPPRDGLKNTHGLIDKQRPFTDIFYVSCNLATFIRDAKTLIEAGYELTECQPLDQTPHTPHIELLNHFKRVV